MGLTDVGVIFKAENYNNFISALGKAAEATALLTNINGNLAYKLEDVSKEIEKNTKVWKSYINVGKEFSKIIEPIDKLGNKLSESDNLLKKFGGTIIRTTIDAGKMGAIIGGAIGAIVAAIPAAMAAFATTPLAGIGGATVEIIATATGAIIGAGGAAYFAIAKAFFELGIGIVEAIGGFFGKIGSAVGKFLGKAVEAIYNAGVSIGKAVVNMVKNIYEKLKSTVESIIGLIKKVFNTLFGMFSGEGAIAGRGGWRGLGSSIFSAMFKFEVLKQVIRSVINEVKQFSQAAFQAAVDLQTLTIRLDNLIAAQIRSAKLTDSYATSIRMASKYTQGLLFWSQKLALATPVSLDDITRTVSLSIAMGWTVEAAKQLTKSIVDYTSATGLGSEVSERIIYNFAQMKQQGKVTGTELRDLGRGAFMPVNEILKIMYEDLGDVNKSFEEFKQEASEGKVSVEGFFNAFNEYVAKNMPDAAYKMNYTFAAVMDNMRDLFKILLGWNVLGPMIASLTKPMQDMIERLSSRTVIANLNAIGKAMAFLVESIRAAFGEIGGQLKRVFGVMGLGVPTIENVVKSIIKLGLLIQWLAQQIGQFIYHTVRPFAKEVGDKIGGTFDGLNKDAFGWGFGLISNFVQGMLKAVTSLLVKIITFISNLIRRWFKISSPPKIAPKIDEWGAGTINEWINGMVESANYNKVKEVGNQVGLALAKSIPDQTITVPPVVPVSPTVDPNKLAPATNPNLTNQPGTITYTPILSATDPTTLSKNLTDNVDKAVTIAAPSISQEGLRLANEFMHGFSQADFDVLDEIQGSLNDVLSALVNLGSITQEQSSQMYVNISQKLIQGLDEFNRTGKISIDIFSELKNIGGVFGQEIKELVQLEIEYAMAVERVTAAQKAYDDAVKASNLSLLKVNKLIRGYNDALRKGANKKTLKENLKLVNASEIQYGINKKNESIKEQELEIAKEQQKVIEEQVKWQRALIENLVELTKKQSDAAGGLSEDLGELGEDINALLEGLGDPETWKLLDFDKLLSDAKTEFNLQLSGIKDSWNTFIGENFGEGSPIKKALGGIWDTLTTVWNTKIGPSLRKLWDDFASYVHLPSWDEILSAWEEPTTWKAPPPGVAISGPLGTDVSRIEKPTLTSRFQSILEKFKEDIGNRGILDILKPIGQWILDKIIEGFNAAVAPTGFLNSILDKLFGAEAGLTEQEGKQGSKEFIANLGFGERLFNILVEQITLGWQKYSPQIIGFMKGVGVVIADSVFSGAAQWVKEKVAQFCLDVFGPYSIFTQEIFKIFGIGSPSTVFEGYGSDLVEGLFNGFKDAITALWGIMTQGLDLFIKNIEDYFGIGLKLFENSPLYKIGVAIIDGIKQGIISGYDGLKKLLSIIGIELPDILETAEGIESPSKVFANIGKNMMLGLKMGVEDSSNLVNDAIVNSLKNPSFTMSLRNAPMQAIPVSSGITNTFGDTYINNDMDWAIFKARVQRAMTER